MHANANGCLIYDISSFNGNQEFFICAIVMDVAACLMHIYQQELRNFSEIQF